MTAVDSDRLRSGAGTLHAAGKACAATFAVQGEMQLLHRALSIPARLGACRSRTGAEDETAPLRKRPAGAGCASVGTRRSRRTPVHAWIIAGCTYHSRFGARRRADAERTNDGSLGTSLRLVRRGSLVRGRAVDGRSPPTESCPSPAAHGAAATRRPSAAGRRGATARAPILATTGFRRDRQSRTVAAHVPREAPLHIAGAGPARPSAFAAGSRSAISFADEGQPVADHDAALPATTADGPRRSTRGLGRERRAATVPIECGAAVKQTVGSEVRRRKARPRVRHRDAQQPAAARLDVG
jgi:hypothetical protein